MKKRYLWLLASVAVLAALPWACDQEALRRFLDDIRRGDAPADETAAQVPLGRIVTGD